jgi:hypothetical protein
MGSSSGIYGPHFTVWAGLGLQAPGAAESQLEAACVEGLEDDSFDAGLDVVSDAAGFAESVEEDLLSEAGVAEESAALVSPELSDPLEDLGA